LKNIFLYIRLILEVKVFSVGLKPVKKGFNMSETSPSAIPPKVTISEGLESQAPVRRSSIMHIESRN
jgi:hypothetical protein